MDELKVPLTPEQFNVVMQGLGELPLKVSGPVHQHLFNVAREHEQAQEKAVEEQTSDRPVGKRKGR